MGKTKKEQNNMDTPSVFNTEMTDSEKQELTDLEKEAEELAKEVEEIPEEEDESFVETAIDTIDSEKEPVEMERENDDFEREMTLASLDKEDEEKREAEKLEEEQPLKEEVAKKGLPKKPDKKKINLPQPVKYACFTLSAGAIQFIVSSILFLCLPDMGNIDVIITMKKSQFIANTVGLALSVLWNFTFNRKFTFKSAGNVPRAMFLAFLFYVPFYPFQIWCEPTLAHAIAPGQDWANIFALIVVMLTNGVLEFCWQKFVIYRKEENTAVPKQKIS